jgi:hypothetical protein
LGKRDLGLVPVEDGVEIEGFVVPDGFVPVFDVSSVGCKEVEEGVEEDIEEKTKDVELEEVLEEDNARAVGLVGFDDLTEDFADSVFREDNSEEVGAGGELEVTLLELEPPPSPLAEFDEILVSSATCESSKVMGWEGIIIRRT